MAFIRPFKAWRYNEEVSGDIADLTSPLFDVVSEKQREHLYQNPKNSIHLSVPRGNEPFKNAKRIFDSWLANGVILQDELEGIYPYYQVFSLPGVEREFIRKGFICLVKIGDQPPSILLHENTIPQAVSGRLDLLRETRLNVSATHGLFHDEEFLLEPLLDHAISKPIYETEDYQGVKDVLGIIQDPDIHKQFQRVLNDQKIILADGHHRYQSAVQYQAEMQAGNPGHNGEEGYNYHMMYLTNSASKDLRILPTHRLVNRIEGFNEETLLKRIEEFFTIREIDEVYELPEILAGKPHAFGMITKENCYKLRLKEGAEAAIRWKFPDSIKKLDLTILHYFIIELGLGIPGKSQRADEHVRFERNFTTCLESVHKGDSQVAFITNEIKMEEVIEVCHSGYTMPQKSTYFYPKAICGYLFASLEF